MLLNSLTLLIVRVPGNFFDFVNNLIKGMFGKNENAEEIGRRVKI